MSRATIVLKDMDGTLVMQTTFEPMFDPATFPSHDHADTLLKGLAQIAVPVGDPVDIVLAGDRRPVRKLQDAPKVRNADGQLIGWGGSGG